MFSGDSPGGLASISCRDLRGVVFWPAEGSRELIFVPYRRQRNLVVVPAGSPRADLLT